MSFRSAGCRFIVDWSETVYGRHALDHRFFAAEVVVAGKFRIHGFTQHSVEGYACDALPFEMIPILRNGRVVKVFLFSIHVEEPSRPRARRLFPAWLPTVGHSQRCPQYFAAQTPTDTLCDVGVVISDPQSGEAAIELWTVLLISTPRNETRRALFLDHCWSSRAQVPARLASSLIA